MYHISVSSFSLTLSTFPEVMPASLEVMENDTIPDDLWEASDLKPVTGKDVEGSFSGTEVVEDMAKVTLACRKCSQFS